MPDPFSNAYDAPTGPSRAPFAVTPHDSNALATIPKALRVGTGGTLILRGVAGAADVTLKNVANGEQIDIAAQYVRATGTTCADIVALA